MTIAEIDERVIVLIDDETTTNFTDLVSMLYKTNYVGASR